MENELTNELLNKGYLIFRNTLDNNIVEYAKDNIKDDKVYYPNMNDVIKNILNVVDDKLECRCHYTKYRVSDNNNSSDASTFHRDVFTHRDENILEIFTVLSYLDKTVMEIIPESHKYKHIPFSKSLSMYNNKERLTLYPGDVMIFSCFLLHRGIFTERLPHRRLIQIFEVYKNKNIQDKIAHNIVHLPPEKNGYNKKSEVGAKLLQSISKTQLIDIVGMFSYFNASSGYGYTNNILDKYNMDYKCISSEGLLPRLSNEDKMGWGKINRYYLKYNCNDVPDEYISDFVYNCFTKQVLYYLFIVILLLVLLVYLTIKAIKLYDKKKSLKKR